MKNLPVIQGVLSIAALFCIAVGWFGLFSDEINEILSRRVFYILIGVTFLIQAPLLSNKKFMYPMFVAAALCLIGAFLPIDSRFASIKTIGLLAGVIFSMSNRQRVNR